MAVPPDLLSLPDDFRTTGDPHPQNPFPVSHVGHRVWADATRVAEEEICRFTSEYTAETAWSRNEDFIHVVTLAKFDAWARRTVKVVWSDEVMRQYRQLFGCLRQCVA